MFEAELTLYAHFAAALINGDLSGLEENEINEVLELQKDIYNYLQCDYYNVFEMQENTYFGFPELGGKLAGTVGTFNVSFSTEESKKYLEVYHGFTPLS